VKKSRAYLSFILGLIISFPIIFQSFHAIEHHILEDNYQVQCCAHHENTQQSGPTEQAAILDTEIDLCPICEYQIVYFLNEAQIIPQQDFVFLHELKTPILNQPVVPFRDCKNKLRGPPIA
jgi:hypothetical protein